MDEQRSAEIRVEREGHGADEHQRSDALPSSMQVRDEDLEPHAGLRYIARLFKILSILVILVLVAEVIIGMATQGREYLPTLMIEVTRLIVFAGLLWGAADMALMLIESNHDLRATRILVGRLNGKIQRLEEASALAPPREGSRPGGMRTPEGR